MTITGGTYLEYCLVPDWKELYGSGWRAVCALSDYTKNIKFYSYLGDKEKELLSINPVFEEIGSENIHLFSIEKTIRFEYFHGLSRPNIIPDPYTIVHNETIAINDDVILRYGFMEGDAKVKGKRVVYDPQSATSPKDFYENGSEAEELVVVLNYREAILLAGSEEINEIKRKLLQENTIALIIKFGPMGGKIITKDYEHTYSAYKSDFVFPIGSGDIFTAFIAYFWGQEEKNLHEAVMDSSKAVAVYCNSQTLPVRQSSLEKNFPLVEQKYENEQKKKTVYLAGPFFNMQQRWLIEESRKYLQEHWIKVFSPLHDVGKGIADNVVPEDIRGIEEADVLFAIVDGLDAGTIFEIGYAKAVGKEVIVYVENESKENLKMLEGTGCLIVHDFVTSIYKTKWLLLERQ